MVKLVVKSDLINGDHQLHVVLSGLFNTMLINIIFHQFYETIILSIPKVYL